MATSLKEFNQLQDNCEVVVPDEQNVWLQLQKFAQVMNRFADRLNDYSEAQRAYAKAISRK